MKKAVDRFEQAISKGEFICMFCKCSIMYSGRAEAYLDVGDRLIIIKQDRTLLIHQPVGGMPINYLRPPANINLSLQKNLEGKEILEVHAQSKEDEINITILKVYDIYSRRLEDGQKQELSGNESEMSDMIKENPYLISDDFIPLSREEHTKYGFIDVFGHNGEGKLVIVECKRFTGGLAAVTQLRRYVEKMKKAKGTDNVTGVLAAPGITTNALGMMQDWGLRFQLVEPPKRNINTKKRQKRIDQFFN